MKRMPLSLACEREKQRHSGEIGTTGMVETYPVQLKVKREVLAYQMQPITVARIVKHNIKVRAVLVHTGMSGGLHLYNYRSFHNIFEVE